MDFPLSAWRSGAELGLSEPNAAVASNRRNYQPEFGLGSRRFHLEGGDGDFYRLAMAEDSWKGPNQYISQAYVFGRPFGSLPIRIEAGKFFTSVGAELAQSDRDFNTSRSLISWYGSPLYHVGIRSSAPITERFTIGAQLLSGCNTTGGAHGHQSMAYTAAWAGKHGAGPNSTWVETRSW
jgi:hypothetical protein